MLGSLLIDPDAIIKVSTTLRDTDFYRERHQWIYSALLALYERREPADFVTLVDELERNEQLDGVGGPAYITELINSTPTAIYVDHYARNCRAHGHSAAPDQRRRSDRRNGVRRKQRH